MEKNFNEKSDRSKPWEVLGVIFVAWATTKDAPEILRKLNIQNLIFFKNFVFVKAFKNFLLKQNSNADFWLCWAYLTASIIISFTIILWLRKDYLKKEKEEEKEDSTNKIYSYLRYYKTLRILRSFGLVLIREWILKLMSVCWYETFKRPFNWDQIKGRFNFIDRVRFVDGSGTEYQYSSDFSKIIFCTHSPETDKYGEYIKRPPRWFDIKLLIIASNFFPFWFLVYTIKKSFLWIRKKATSEFISP